MKRILVVCGNGIASSSIMVSILNDFIKSEKMEAQVEKSSLMACNADTFNSFDLVVSSTKLDNPEIKTPVIVGAGLLTGIGEEDIFDAVKATLAS